MAGRQEFIINKISLGSRPVTRHFEEQAKIQYRLDEDGDVDWEYYEEIRNRKKEVIPNIE